MGQYKLIEFFCEIRTDGDFSFKLIPPCMRMDFDKEHYKIEFSESPAYNETDEEFLNRIIKKLLFIRDTLNTYIVGKDWFIKECWPKFGEYINEAIEIEYLGKNNKMLSKKVNQYDLGGNFIKSYPSTKEIERQLGIQTTLISQCCRGLLKTSGGFIWKYADEEYLKRN